MTRTELINYTKTLLGEPIIRVEVANVQFNSLIDKCLKDFHRYHYGEGVYLDYAFFTVSAGISTYNLSGYDISDVPNIYIQNNNLGGINTVHSPTHIFFQERGQGPGHGPLQQTYYGYVPGLEITEYEIAMQYIDLIDFYFAKDYTTNWLPDRQVLKIIPTPDVTDIGLLTLYRKEQEQFLLDNSLFQELFLARVKRLWGFILSKSTIQMPGGGTINGQNILTEGKEDEAQIMEQIKGESQPIDPLIG